MSDRVVIQYPGSPGLLAGLLGCVFGVLGIFTLGIIFVPLAALCSLVGLLRGIFGFSASGIGTSLLAACLCVFGFAMSPSLWGVAGGLFATDGLMQITSPVMQQRQAARPSPSSNPAPVTTQNPVRWALEITVQVINECRSKRISGELPSFVASAQCSNPPMLAAFNEVHYKYMDLIQFYAAKRLEFATKIDRGEMTEQQAKIETEKVLVNVQSAERQRDGQ